MKKFHIIQLVLKTRKILFNCFIYSICFILCFILFGQPVFANLYEISLPIENNNEVNEILIQQAFKNVLIQITGTETILTTPNTNNALKNVDNFVKRFSHKLDSQKKHFFTVLFDEKKINELIKSEKFSIWQQKRPTTSVWMVIVKEKNQPIWIGGDSEQELMNEFNQLAKQRALPLVFPLLDLTESTQITEKNILNNDLDIIKKAASRYKADRIWFGKITKQESGWYGQWSLISDNKISEKELLIKTSEKEHGTKNSEKELFTWDKSHEDLNQLCREALDELTQYLAKESANQTTTNIEFVNKETNKESANIVIVNNEMNNIQKNSINKPQNFVLGIKGIKDITQYAKVLEYLKTIPEMSEVEVQQISQDQTIFKLSTPLTLEVLKDQLAKGPLEEEKWQLNYH